MTQTHRAFARNTRLAVAIACLLGLGVVAPALGEQDEDLLTTLEQRLIPAEGAETTYGIPYSLASLPQFVEWWYTLVPLVGDDPRYITALSALVAPCCDDNPAYKCCCENGEGQACNIIRSGKGLAAHLIHDLDFDAEQVESSVLAWFHFARSDYYLARALEAEGVWAGRYGLTTKGSCYRRLCDTPISAGGCGGMNELIEPTLGS